jgi:hypothetical protein
MKLPEERSQPRATLVVIGLLFLGIIVGAWLHSADSVSGPEVASIWTSVVLTLFLAYIYSRQNEILELQSRIMGGSHTPILSVSNLTFTDEEPNSGNAIRISNDGEFLSFSVVNEGNDIAVGLSIVYIPTFVLGNDLTDSNEVNVLEDVVVNQIPPSNYENRLIDSSVPPHFARGFPVYSTKTTTEASDVLGATVPTEGGTQKMYAQAGFYVSEDGQRKPIGFARGIQQLLKDDFIEAVIVGRVLTYQNPFEKSSYIVLPALRFDQEGLDPGADRPFDAVLRNQGNQYTSSDYREQIEQCAEAYLDGNSITYFEAC